MNFPFGRDHFPFTSLPSLFYCDRSFRTVFPFLRIFPILECLSGLYFLPWVYLPPPSLSFLKSPLSSPLTPPLTDAPHLRGQAARGEARPLPNPSPRSGDRRPAHR